ncbi:MAG TPA: RNA methyltransferase [Pyrinomonadaceae bacterium]|nr:RNA methyltransferase [Chloracidobacterium sp.]HQY67861.1 RNA methyltransferase [Pyrinomonadaceae bacterium]MBK7804011.1 RNA methyltransferase [Chloracidobacterium sp.]MBK9439321.1 RNA methyltransferase [Chloracidobacterium sp.]MBL0239392.1 RNA methyltransferase [Chloracidobacterium sp.]
MIDLPKITSRDNQRLVNVRKVRDHHVSDKVFVEGKRLAAEALRSDVSVSACFVSERFVMSDENSRFIMELSSASRFIFELPDRVFQTIAATEHSQGVILIAERPEKNSLAIESRLSGGKCLPIVVLLYHINNPSNLGAVLRTAEAAGVAGIIITKQSADVYSPKSIRASMGSIFRMAIWNDVELDPVLRWAADKGLRATTTAAAATATHTAVDWSIPRLLIFGSEAHGLNGIDLGISDERVKIAIESPVESLNLAVSAGIILFEAKRQIDSKPII